MHEGAGECAPTEALCRAGRVDPHERGRATAYLRQVERPLQRCIDARELDWDLDVIRSRRASAERGTGMVTTGTWRIRQPAAAASAYQQERARGQRGQASHRVNIS